MGIYAIMVSMYECLYSTGTGEVHVLLFLQESQEHISVGRGSSCIALQGYLRGRYDIVPEWKALWCLGSLRLVKCVMTEAEYIGTLCLLHTV